MLLFHIFSVVLECVICVNVFGVEESVKRLHEIFEWSCGNVQPVLESQVHCSVYVGVWSSDPFDITAMKRL